MAIYRILWVRSPAGYRFDNDAAAMPSVKYVAMVMVLSDADSLTRKIDRATRNHWYVRREQLMARLDSTLDLAYITYVDLCNEIHVPIRGKDSFRRSYFAAQYPVLLRISHDQ